MRNISNQKVSVLVPAFNRADFIEETIESVLQQDYPDLELIVVDDGSTDGTYEILCRYAEQHRVKLFTHKNRVNRGQSASLNLGLKRAEGNYIAVLDSDDKFLPGKVSSQVNFLKANSHIGLVYGMGEAIDESGRWLYDILSEGHVEPNDPNAVLLDCYFLLPQNALVRREIYEEVGGFNESFRAAQDHDMLIRMAEKTSFGFMPKKLFQYRRHSNSISSKGQRLRWETGFEILEGAKSRYPYERSTIRKRRALLNFRMAQVCWHEKQHVGALKYLLTSGYLDPSRALKVLTGQEKVQ